LSRVEERGWFAPWYSSHGSDFNYDFRVTLDALLAILLWPADRHPAAPFVAARAVGQRGPGS
jgi:Bacterial protein of unknown function (DUF899)